MPRPILRGSIDITDNYELVYEILRDQSSNIIVVDMDDDEDPNIPINHPRVIKGSCLLPPMEAIIAAVDGEKEVFRMMYSEHFSTPFIDSFVGALIIYLCNGGKLLISYNDDIGIVEDFIRLFWMRYGIQIGIVGETESNMNPDCLPIWLQYMYRENTITAEDFLYNYPVNTVINPAMISKLLNELAPYGSNYQERVQELYKMVGLYKQTPNLQNPLMWVE